MIVAVLLALAFAPFGVALAPVAALLVIGLIGTDLRGGEPR